MRRALTIASRLRAAAGEVSLSERPCSLAASARPYYASYDPSKYAPGHGGTGMIGTTVLCVRKDGKVVIIADGQVTMGGEVVKPNVKKVRRIGKDVIAGFAGATADAFTLFERLEMKLEENSGQLTRACVELAKAWRMDKFLRRLDAVMIVADAKSSLQITGNGDVLEPHDGIISIGSGGAYAGAAARALRDVPDYDAMRIAKKAMTIAADACIYTNHNFTVETIDEEAAEQGSSSAAGGGTTAAPAASAAGGAASPSQS